MNDKEHKNLLFEKCGLIKSEDIFKSTNKKAPFTIIKKSGIEKIISHLNIEVTIDEYSSYKDHASVKVTAKMDNEVVEELGSANHLNCPVNKYYLEMALKRATSRVVLKITKLSLYGFVGEESANIVQEKNGQYIEDKLNEYF